MQVQFIHSFIRIFFFQRHATALLNIPEAQEGNYHLLLISQRHLTLHATQGGGMLNCADLKDASSLASTAVAGNFQYCAVMIR